MSTRNIEKLKELSFGLSLIIAKLLSRCNSEQRSVIVATTIHMSPVVRQMNNSNHKLSTMLPHTAFVDASIINAINHYAQRQRCMSPLDCISSIFALVGVSLSDINEIIIGPTDTESNTELTEHSDANNTPPETNGV